MVKKLFLALLTIYQKVFTLLSFGSCRYYPTCSEYARWRVEKENLFVALFWIVVRILRCNQLFPGGIDYPVVSRRFDNICYKRIDVKFWFVPKGGSKFFLIKNFKG